MIDYSSCFEDLLSTPMSSKIESMENTVQDALSASRWGDMPQWASALTALPKVNTNHLRLDQAIIEIGIDSELSVGQQRELKHNLMALHPWRKGPYKVFGTHIDTEWRSDYKWDRLKNSISPLKNRRILDVGCGSGYHCWRMLGADAKLVLGIDPSAKFILQFYALKNFLATKKPIHLLPLALEDMPNNSCAFDTVFSMGVLYHRRSPIDHLLDLKQCLVKGGELVIETLVCEDAPCVSGSGKILVPQDRYAKMRNVWFLPSPQMLAHWLERCGFHNIRLVDVSTTTIKEQRATEWMHFDSLQDFLDPNDQSKTIEGLPAPRRAIFVASR